MAKKPKRGLLVSGPKAKKAKKANKFENLDNAPNVKIRLNNEASWCVDGTPGWYSLAVQFI